MSATLGLARTAASIPGLMRELEESASRDPRPLLVTGPPSSAHRLAAELARDGEARLVRVLPVAALSPDTLAGAAALIHVLSGRPTPTDERLLGEVRRAGLHVVCLALGADAVDARLLGLVRAWDVVSADAIDPEAVGSVARRVAAGLDDGWLLARRLPVLRKAVCRAMAGRYAREGAVTAAARPGGWQEGLASDLRLCLRAAAGHGRNSDRRVNIVVGSLAAAAAAGRLLGGRGGSRARGIALAYVSTWAAGRVAAAYLDRDPARRR